VTNLVLNAHDALKEHGRIEVRTEHRDGRVVLSVPQGPFRRRWVARHFDYQPGRQFRDEQVSGPFNKWVHTHRVLPSTDGAGHSVLHDHVPSQETRTLKVRSPY